MTDDNQNQAFLGPENHQNSIQGEEGNQTEPASSTFTGPSQGTYNGERQDEQPELELDPRRCHYIYPEGHPKAGTQCQGWRVRKGEHCPGHSGLGIAASPEAARRAAQAGARERQEQAQARSEARKRASLSLADRASAFLDREDVQEAVEARWLATIRDGSDSDARQLLRDLMDRAFGRVTEKVELSQTLSPDEEDWLRQMREIRAITELSDEELERRLEAREGGESDDA